MLLSILSAALIFALLIVVHEAGHFAVAKQVGVRVIRFSIGYPPKLFGIRRGGTEYAIGATPFGGYVRMLGDEVADDPGASGLQAYLKEIELDLLGAARAAGKCEAGSDAERILVELAGRLGEGRDEAAGAAEARATLGRELAAGEALLLSEIRRRGSLAEAEQHLAATSPETLMEAFRARAFPTQSLGKRVAIVLAGPAANILFAPILLTLVFMYGVPTLLPVLGQVKPGLPAYSAGLRSGDRVLALDGKPIASWGDLSDLVKASGGRVLRFEIERQGPSGMRARSVVSVRATRQNEKTMYGNSAPTWIIGVMPRGDETIERYGLLRAVREAGVSSWSMTQGLVVGLAKIVEGQTPVREALGGPIMIAQMAGQEAHAGLAQLAMFTVMLSLELGIINLLPVPLLDGGHLFFFLLEGLRGKPVQLHYRELAMQVGFLLLVALMAFVLVNDLSRIAQG